MPPNSQQAAKPVVRPIFSRGRIGALELRNRFVQAPLYTYFASPWGEACDKIIDYYRARARGGVGLIITENAAIDWSVGKGGNPLRIDHDRFRPGLRHLVEAVHNEGARIALQLHHSGRQNSSAQTETGEPPIAPTAGLVSPGGSPPRAIERDEITPLIEKYAQGALRARNAGFDAVELHGAHGYLLSQFLSPKTNRRTDEYGGTLENRARFALETVAAVRKAVGVEFPIIYRMSVEEPYEGGLSLADGLAFAQMIAPHVDALDVSAGNHETSAVISSLAAPGNLLPYALAVRERVDVPVIAVGRLDRLIDELDEAVDAGKLDFVAFGRAQLADAEIVGKMRRGALASVRPCIACNECLAGAIGKGFAVRCVVNPELGQEARAAAARTKVGWRKKVLVVGGGPAGMEAARTAGLRGHDVTLIERAAELGGMLQSWAAAVLRRREIEQLIAYYAEGIQTAGVKLELGGAFSRDIVEDYDVVLLATGTVPVASDQSGLDAIDMMRRRIAPEPEALVVYGAADAALYAALWLTEQGKTVEIHSPSAEIAGSAPLAVRLLPLLREAKVAMRTRMPKPKGSADVVWAHPRAPSHDWDELLEDDHVRAVGSRLRGGGLYEATQSGFWAAASL